MRPGEELALGERPWEGTAPPRDHGFLANLPGIPVQCGRPGHRPGRHARFVSDTARRSVRPDSSGRTLTADRLAIAVFGQLATVMNKEATRTGELVSLPRDDPE